MGRKVLLIGIGQTGCTVAELFSEKMNKDGETATVIAIDTDENMLDGLEHVKTVPMTAMGELSSVVSAIGEAKVRGWFPCDYAEDKTDFIKTLRMDSGANQWRMKAYLSFASFMSKETELGELHDALDAAAENISDGDAGLEIYTVASLAGGTGSALFLPTALYVKKYFEEKGTRISSSKAILAMPDICEHCYSADQRVKGYANAYAALREYNALLGCACAKESGGEKHPPVSFRLGEEGGPIPLLFDSTSEKYQTPEANPFNNVYLFERVPGVTSAGAHAEIIADIITSIYKNGEKKYAEETENEKTADAVIGGFSLINVKYPIKSTVNYIARKQLKDLFVEEVIFLHGRTVAELNRRRGEAKLYGSPYEANTEQYADSMTSVADAIVYESGTALSLIGRDPNLFVGDETGDGVFDMDHLSGISEFINEKLACESADIIDRIISGPQKPAVGADGKKIKEKKKSQKTIKKETADMALECGRCLTDVYRKGLKISIEEKEAFKDALISNTDGGFSLTGSVVKQNGKFIHPAYALLRLCLVRKDLEKICAGTRFSAMEEPESENAVLSDSMLEISDSSRDVTKYSRAGSERFKKLIFDEDGKYSKKFADDRNRFIYDLEAVFEALKLRLRSYCYSAALEAVDSLIKKYREFVSYMQEINGEMVSEEKLALIRESGADGNIINVGASCAEKQSAYAEYSKKYIDDTARVAEYTEKIGERVYSAIFARADGESVREAVLGSVEETEKIFAEQCESSEFYRTKLDKNVLEAILGASERRDSGMTLSRALRGRPVSIHIKMPEDHREYLKVKTRTVAVFDTEIKRYLEENPKLTRGRSPKEYLERLMYSAGEYIGEAEFADGIGAKNMQLRCETSGIKLSLVEAVNESADGRCFNSFKKSMVNSETYSTAMWDPNLIYDRESTEKLPYIDTEARKKYETDVCRAIICALSSEELLTETYEGENVYVRRVGVEKEPVLDGDRAVSANDPREIILWAYRSPEWVGYYAERFEKKEKTELMHVPAQAVDGSSIGIALRMVERSETVSAVREHALRFAAELISADPEDSFGYAARFAELSYLTVVDFCERAYRRNDERFIRMYNRCVGKTVMRLAETLGEEKTRATVVWMNGLGLFGYYGDTGLKANYRFDLPQVDTDCLDEDEDEI